MSIVLLILKVIGIVLLCLTGLILFFLLLALFCPVTYRIQGMYHDKKLKLHARVFSLFYLIGLCVDVEKDSSIYLRIFGIKKHFLDQEEHMTFENKSENPDEEETVVPGKKEEHIVSGSEIQVQEKRNEEKDQTAYEEKQGFFSKLIHKIKEIRNKIKQFFKKIKHTLEHLRENVEKIGSFMKDESHKMAFMTLKTNFFKLLKILQPRKMKLDLNFSTGSPDTTGQMLGVLALFPVGYKNRWNIVPDFTADKFYAEADFDIKGHLFGIQLLKIGLRIILDKNCQKLYNNIMK